MIDLEHLPYLKVLISKLDDFHEKLNQPSFTTFTSEFQSFMDRLFFYHGRMEHHSDFHKFHQDQIGKRQDSRNFPDVLRGLYVANTDHIFLQLCPFIGDILDLYDAITPHLFIQNLSRLFTINQRLKQCVHFYETIYPLQVMGELLNAAMRKPYNQGKLRKLGIALQELSCKPELAIALFGVDVQKHIPYKVRDRHPYNAVDWRMMEILGNMVHLPKYEQIVRDTMKDFTLELPNLYIALQGILQWEQARFDTTLLKPTVAPLALPIIQSVTDIFEDCQNLERMQEALCALEQLKTDSKVNRFAIIRLLSILGECAKNLSPLVKPPASILCQLEIIRDGILHPAGGSVYEVLDSLVHNSSDQRLLNLAQTELFNLRTFVNSVYTWRAQNPNTTTSTPFYATAQPSCPLMDELKVHLSKNFRLTLMQRNKLLLTLPLEDSRDIKKEKNELLMLLNDQMSLPSKHNFFERFAIIGLTERKLKELYVKFQQFYLAKELLVFLKNMPLDEAAVKDKLTRLQLDKKQKNTYDSIVATDAINWSAVFDIVNECRQKHSKEIHAMIIKQSDVIDLVAIKKTLSNSILQNTKDIPDNNKLNLLLSQLRINLINDRQAWIEAFEILNNLCPSHYSSVVPQERFDIYTRLFNCVTRIIKVIKLLEEINQTHIENDDRKAAFNAFSKDWQIILASEYVLGLIKPHVDILLTILDEAKDYSDILAHSIFLRHPLDELRKELEGYQLYRNDIAHLHSVYLRPHETPFLDVIRLYSIIEHFTRGILFENAIVISPTSVSHQPSRSESILNQLEKTKQYLEAEGQKSRWKKFVDQPHMSYLLREYSLWREFTRTDIDQMRLHRDASLPKLVLPPPSKSM